MSKLSMMKKIAKFQEGKKVYRIAYLDDDEAALKRFDLEVDGFNEKSHNYKIDLHSYDNHKDFIDEYLNGDFDGAILDIFLRDITGFDLLKQVWRKGKPAIMCSYAIGADEDLVSMMPKDKMKVSEVMSRLGSLAKDLNTNIFELTFRAKDARYARA